MIQNNPPRQFLTSNKIDSYLNLIKSTSTTQYILIPMITPLFDFLWPQLVPKYTLTPIYKPDGGSKALCTGLGEICLGWTLEESGQVHEMMQRKDITSMSAKFQILVRSSPNWVLCVPKLRLRGCRRHYNHHHGWMVRWYIVLAGLPNKVWIAWTHTPLETVDRWFKSGKR